jgi:hypothetical protein
MKVTTTKKVYDEVEIPNDHILELAIKVIKHQVALDGAWIDDGNVYREVHTSHSYDVCEGKATPEQLAASDTIAALRNYIAQEKNHE